MADGSQPALLRPGGSHGSGIRPSQCEVGRTMDTSDVIALCAAAASVVISVGALLLSRYLGHRSVDEATRAADAAERSADAAEQANEFVQQASRKGIRAPDA